MKEIISEVNFLLTFLILSSLIYKTPEVYHTPTAPPSPPPFPQKNAPDANSPPKLVFHNYQLPPFSSLLWRNVCLIYIFPERCEIIVLFFSV